MLDARFTSDETWLVHLGLLVQEADFGATDTGLADEDYEQVPGLQLLPTMAAAVVPIYNLGGVCNINIHHAGLYGVC